MTAAINGLKEIVKLNFMKNKTRKAIERKKGETFWEKSAPVRRKWKFREKLSSAVSALFQLFTCARKWTYQKQIIAKRIGKCPFAWHGKARHGIVWCSVVRCGAEFECNAMWLPLHKTVTLEPCHVHSFQFEIAIIAWFANSNAHHFTHSLTVSLLALRSHSHSFSFIISLKQQPRTATTMNGSKRLDSTPFALKCCLFAGSHSLVFDSLCVHDEHISLRILYFHCIVSHTNGVANNKYTDKHRRTARGTG